MSSGFASIPRAPQSRASSQRRGALGRAVLQDAGALGEDPLRGLFDAGAIQQRRRGIAAGEGNHAGTAQVGKQFADGRTGRFGEGGGVGRVAHGRLVARGGRSGGQGGVFGRPAGRGRAPAIRPGRLRTARSRRARRSQVAFEGRARFVGRVVALLCAAQVRAEDAGRAHGQEVLVGDRIGLHQPRASSASISRSAADGSAWRRPSSVSA